MISVYQIRRNHEPVPIEKIIYRSGSTELEGVLVFDASLTAPAAGLVMAPNWMGVTEASVSLAEKAAARGYVVLIADLYGKGVRPGSAEEAGTVMMSVKNTDEEVGRMAAAMQALTSQTDAPVTADKVAVFGFVLADIVRWNWPAVVRR